MQKKLKLLNLIGIYPIRLQGLGGGMQPQLQEELVMRLLRFRGGIGGMRLPHRVDWLIRMQPLLVVVLLLEEEEEEEGEELTAEEQKERKIMKLLLKVKNGTPPQRKTALRQLTDKAREFGAGPLLNRILPLLMQPTLEDQERHLLEIGRPCGMTLRTF
ncbi:hypothetical protein HYC85_025397 [Camellia sinensis]|uniref:Uncharacterized protein n=1 Tax=Camellia sinensis TaxID=4442 RepID=A0A7J7GD58_CAMSI|nr:hypothetical protein HYC85_025397 [Camellia sinensis]